MTVYDVIELSKVLAWPFTALLLVAMLYRSISGMLLAIGERATKFKIFEFEVELAKLEKASGILSTTVSALQQAEVIQRPLEEVKRVESPELVYGVALAGITRSAADYVLIRLGDDGSPAWLSSRLFLLSVFLDRNRAVRCLVFTGSQGRYVGASTPRDIRWELGAKYPEYERALFSAYGLWATTRPDANLFRNGEISEELLNGIASTFLADPSISSWTRPEPAVGRSFVDHSGQPTAQPSTWELAEYVTADSLRAMLLDRLSTGLVTAGPDTSEDEDITRAIVRKTGAFVALGDTSGQFKELYDRTALVDKVARQAAE